MNISRSTLITLGVLLLVLLIAGWFAKQAYDRAQDEKITETPAYQALSASTTEGYTDFSGQKVELTNYVGDVILVHSWASWCPPCVKELRQLSDLADSYDEGQVRVVAINRAEDKRTAESFLRAYDLDLKVELVLDPADKFFKSTDGYQMPETVVYNKEGEVLLRIDGEHNVEVVRAAIDKELSS